jgi:hypothetical protein
METGFDNHLGLPGVGKFGSPGRPHNNIGPKFGEQQHLPGERRFRIYRGGEGVVIDRNQLQGVSRDLDALRDDCGYRFANESYPV